MLIASGIIWHKICPRSELYVEDREKLVARILVNIICKCLGYDVFRWPECFMKKCNINCFDFSIWRLGYKCRRLLLHWRAYHLPIILSVLEHLITHFKCSLFDYFPLTDMVLIWLPVNVVWSTLSQKMPSFNWQTGASVLSTGKWENRRGFFIKWRNREPPYINSWKETIFHSTFLKHRDRQGTNMKLAWVQVTLTAFQS